ncbi:hypothetical protein EW146_g7432 [Bondarzewia mesenterica]|uniref:Uncharacterized protein n=1 Tax=Bondarzewia mesenterica TaxID=1095465 RepID=A0A4S4LKS8_9AGAM|nr:hypothetical protein EW146_g7432 [Bondarzewia mesenterica]
MAHRLPLRNRTGPQRPKINGDENATSKLRQSTSITVAGVSRIGHSVFNAVKNGPQRPALGEVTTTAVNRKDANIKPTGKEKELIETGLKRSRSSSLAAATAPQRVPLGPGRGSTAVPVQTTNNARPSSRMHKLSQAALRPSRPTSQQSVAPIVISSEEELYQEHDMDIEDVRIPAAHVADDGIYVGEEEVEAMLDSQDSDEEEEDAEEDARLTESRTFVWPEVSPGHAARYQMEVDHIRANYEEVADAQFDETMVSEYTEEIFEYMSELEDDIMPNPDYMSGQNEITWQMRQTLVDWLLQVHLRYHMLPETLWIAVNVVDRFLTKRVVSLVKLQLVGVIAMLIASKYEEILAPSVDEFVFMTGNGYSKEEILKGERIVLQTIDFKVSNYCSPYSWMRKISKADDYDVQTRTLSKFLTEVTLLDYRFLSVKPSLVAAVGMYTARRMLGGDWNAAFVYHSGFTKEQLMPGYHLLLDKLTEHGFEKQYINKKYANKKFLKASLFALEWARTQVATEGEGTYCRRHWCWRRARQGLFPALRLASANVVVNDFNQAAAQKVVDEIKAAGGNAVVNNSSVTDGATVIKTALDAFGGITILINNAGILRDKGFKNMSDKEWDQIQEVHLKGAYACTKAAWPIFRKQKFGRIVNTASAAGLFGNFGQANYSAAKMGLVSFTRTLALEGVKYNIKATAIAPMAASAMTETIMPPEMLAKLKPEFVAPFVVAVTHPDGPEANGKVFVVGAGYVSEIRWERSKGVVFKTDASFTPSAVKQRWDDIIDFTNPEYPKSMADTDIVAKLEEAKAQPANAQASPEVRFDGQTVIITGSGAGLGRAYALMYARLGANVVVNDVSEKGALAVVDEIRRAGGKAVGAICSAEAGEVLVKAALDAFGGVHILVANAGILRDKSFTAMSDAEWDAVIAVHLRGTYKSVKAVWPIFQKQKYGRIVTTASGVGIYGNFGQANYSTAKAAILGLTRTLAIEGKKYNVLANTIAPSAGTAMTMTIWPKEMVDAFKPDFVAPIVGYLTSSGNEGTTGSLFEISGGWAAQTRWQQAGGYGFPVKKPFTPEDVLAKWNIITNFDDGRATNPISTQEGMEQVCVHVSLVRLELIAPNRLWRTSEMKAKNRWMTTYILTPKTLTSSRKQKKIKLDPLEYNYSERDVILYNLGIGATEMELQWTYEGHDEFSALPTFGVIPQFMASGGVPLDWLPDYNPAKLLHGEQYLSIKAPIPISGELVNQARLMEVLDKGKAAAVTTVVETKDKHTGQVIFENQSTVFIRGSGGFGGKRTGKDRGPASAANTPPKRQPDAVVEEKTLLTQAALYRLSGDANPLHILPEFAAVGGFDRPILHGLCFMGISGKHVLKTFGAYKDIKVRFAGVVYPGETLVTEMWKEGGKVIFQTKVKERGATVLAAAAVTLVDAGKPIKAKL